MSDEETATAVDNADVEPTPEAAPEAAPSEESETVDKADAEETAEVEEKPKADPKQRKIAKQARDIREMRRQNAKLLQAVEEQSKAVQASQKQGKAPKIEDFESMDSFLDARDDYRDSKREPKAEPKADIDDPRDELFDNGQERYEDFDEVVSGGKSITPHMAAAVFEIDDPDLQVDVAYYLGNNPKEAAKISRLSERRQIAEIAKLEVKVSAKPAAKKQASKAPAPIKPVGGTKTTNDDIQGVENYESFLKKRNKQLGR